MTSRKLGVVSILFLALGSVGLAEPPPDSSSSPGQNSESTPPDAKEYKEIEAIFYGNSPSPSPDGSGSLESRVEAFIRKFPKSTYLSSVENMVGLYLLKEKKPADAQGYFKRAIALSSGDSSFTPYVTYNLAMAYYDANQMNESFQTLDQIDSKSLDGLNRLKVHVLKGNLYTKKASLLEASRQFLTATQYWGDLKSEGARAKLREALNNCLPKLENLDSVRQLYEEFESSPLADSLLFTLGQLELKVSDFTDAERHLRLLINQYPTSPFYANAVDLLGKVKNQSAVDSRTVGVLLPMKGKFSKYASRIFLGIQLAFDIFNTHDTDSKFNLIIEDSGDDPDSAIKALNNLALKHHVIAVIGPLLTKGVAQVAQRAEELGVPLISLARKGVLQKNFVIQGGLTAQMQAQEIARYAIQKLGLRKFAITYPDEKLAREAADTFWDTVVSLGGKVVGVETYSSGETDFRTIVDKLSGLYYKEARQLELDALAKERVANNILKRTHKTEEYFNLKPIVDYEAVFIPDDPKVAGQLLPTFAYRDVDNIKFLGTSEWNTPEFIARTQSYSEHSFLVDAFLPSPSDARAVKFADKFQATFHQEPSVLEAMAYDDALILKSILQTKDQNYDREEVKNKLSAVKNFSGITGPISYSNGQWVRNLKVLTVKNGRFIEPEATGSSPH